jgi:hypothetical protein
MSGGGAAREGSDEAMRIGRHRAVRRNASPRASPQLLLPPHAHRLSTRIASAHLPHELPSAPGSTPFERGVQDDRQTDLRIQRMHPTDEWHTTDARHTKFMHGTISANNASPQKKMHDKHRRRRIATHRLSTHRLSTLPALRPRRSTGS